MLSRFIVTFMRVNKRLLKHEENVEWRLVGRTFRRVVIALEVGGTLPRRSTYVKLRRNLYWPSKNRHVTDL